MAQQQLLQDLTNIQGDCFHEIWKDFFYDVPKVRGLRKIIDDEKAAAVLAAGATWNGNGWNTYKASRALMGLTGVPLVSQPFDEYRNSFLFALSLLWEVDVQALQLSDRGSEAAFALAKVLADEGQVDAEEEER